jgi:hypothetical protein
MPGDLRLVIRFIHKKRYGIFAISYRSFGKPDSRSRVFGQTVGIAQVR